MVKDKHILFIVENNPVLYDRRVWNEVLAVRDFGYSVSVICPKDKRRKKLNRIVEGIRIYQHPMPFEGKNIIGLLLEYLNAIIMEFFISVWLYIKEPFHCIHVANPPDHLFLIALPFKIFGVKFIFDHHDISPETFEAKFKKKGLFYNLLKLMEKLTFKTADKVISTNESYKKIALNRGGMINEDVFVVRNGPDLNKILHQNPNEKIRDGFRYLVGYVGVIGQQEGIENLFESANYLVKEKKRTDIKYIIIGRGPHWEYVTKLCDKMGLSDYFEFTGFIPDSELYEILATVDVCVNPEFCNEFTNRSTMIKIMEYMTFGKPIVQYFTVEGNVSAGESSIYIYDNSIEQFANALISLLDDEEKRKEMGSIGRSRIENELSWDKQKINLESVYNSLFA